MDRVLESNIAKEQLAWLITNGHSRRIKLYASLSNEEVKGNNQKGLWILRANKGLSYRQIAIRDNRLEPRHVACVSPGQRCCELSSVLQELQARIYFRYQLEASCRISARARVALATKVVEHDESVTLRALLDCRRG